MFIYRFFQKLMLVLLLASLGLIGGIWYFLQKPLITSDQGYHYLFLPGRSIQTVIDDLSRQDIIQHPSLFKMLLYLRAPRRHWQAGEYFFPQGTSLIGIINQLATGKGLIYHVFTIVSGWNFQQLREALLKEPNLYHKLMGLSDEEVMKQLGNLNFKPEGFFFPESYYFMRGSSDLMLLKRAYQMMLHELHHDWMTRDALLPFQTMYQALIAASLVEKEAYLNQERVMIAGVLINRLKKGMMLQFDPTVIYGMGNRYKGNITKYDLTKDTSFNTYVHKGLPPTPIAMPSRESIMAVLHPMQHDYLYFVARGDGSHQFSKTLIEHHLAVDSVKRKT